MGAYHKDAAKHPTVIDRGSSRGLTAGNEAGVCTWGLDKPAVTRLNEPVLRAV